MPKVKSNSGAKKRFRVTRKGKVHARARAIKAICSREIVKAQAEVCAAPTVTSEVEIKAHQKNDTL